MSNSAFHYSALSMLKNHIDLAFEMVDKWKASKEKYTPITNSTDRMTCQGNYCEKNLTNLVELLKVMPTEIFAEHSKQRSGIGRVFATIYSPVMEGACVLILNDWPH